MDSSIYDYLDYRDPIQFLSKKLGITFKALATSARIHTSYFSRVMGGRASFSKEQLFLIGKDLKLSSEELEYLLLLGEYGNSGQLDHQNFVKRKITQIQNEKKKLLSKLEGVTYELSKRDIVDYYREAATAKIHILLTIEKYRDNPSLICKKIFISESKLEIELSKLESLGIIERVKNKKLNVLKYSVHLDEADDASIQNHINWRQEVIANLTRRNINPTDYHLSATFSCDEVTKSEIKEVFKNFVAEAQKLVTKAPHIDDAYFIGMDLF